VGGYASLQFGNYIDDSLEDVYFGP
jgi:hypothetical protein